MKIKYAVALAVLVNVVPGVTLPDSTAADLWNPAAEAKLPFRKVQKELNTALGVMFLDDQCRRVGVVMPACNREIGNTVLPGAKRLDDGWVDRLVRLPSQTIAACQDAANPPAFLPLTPVGSDSKANACNPNIKPTTVQDALDVQNSICQMDANAVRYAVVIGRTGSSVLIVEGETARSMVPEEVPAAIVGLKDAGLNPCSPARPVDPCVPPKVASLVGGVCVCVSP